VPALPSQICADIAAKHYTQSAKVLSITPLAPPRPKALKRICQLPNAKPELAFLNPGPGGQGFAETVPSLAAMSDSLLTSSFTALCTGWR